MGKEAQHNRRVVVVSNRLPYTLKRFGDSWRTEKSVGGLASAMGPILKRTNGIWIGWSGDESGVKDAGREQILDRWAQKKNYVAVDLPAEMARGFYEGYSNQTIWPLFHYSPSLVRSNPREWQAYVEANALFRDKVLEQWRPGDLVWIHDYHLMLLPRMLREAKPEISVGFFLHIPFPSSSVFRVLPKREELLRGLIGADYVAFHTHSYLQHFRSSLLRVLGLPSEMDRVNTNNRVVRLDALPIGIAPNDFTDLLDKDPTTMLRLAELRKRFVGRKVILGVDRLDYTKGIPERLRAFRRFLRTAPQWHGKVVLVQIAVPSRELVPMYKQLRKEVDELIGKLDGELSTPDWSPVIYLRRSQPRSELAALYAAADVALVTPLCDGLNLVAKEYVACHRDGNGVLVLSEFAGAAAEMGEALLVNPYDEDRMVEVVAHALELSGAERNDRMLALRKRVTKNNAFAWGERFLLNLEGAAAARSNRFSGGPRRLPADTVVKEFRDAPSRLLLLDYDGTLVGHAKRPQDAAPPKDLIRSFEDLTQLPGTAVAIVSGRSRADLERWFGKLPKLWLAAEHGAIMRSPASMNWEHFGPNGAAEWKARVLPVLDHFVDRTPGSLIEEKEFSVVWHYRMADPEFGEWLANELVSNLEQMLAETHIRAVKGEKFVEVKVVWARKGAVFARMTEGRPAPTFLLAAGDDPTDEDLFAQLPDYAWTIHVGRTPSAARYRLSQPGEMRELLRSFARQGARVTAVA